MRFRGKLLKIQQIQQAVLCNNKLFALAINMIDRTYFIKSNGFSSSIDLIIMYNQKYRNYENHDSSYV